MNLVGAAGEADSEAWPRPGVAWYALGVFALVLMFLMLDRGIITLLVQPIKQDLRLSDTEFSLLLGPAVIVFYAFVGLPLSRFVDLHNRKVMLACGIAVWSIATAFCGAASSFAMLLLCRFFVGAGESINGPATYSMMADFFPPRRLPRAIAVLQIGFMAGSGLSMIAGAFVISLLAGSPETTLPIIGTVHNWQVVFWAVGLPGVLVALLMLTVQEPPRRGRRLVQGQKAVPVVEVFRFLLGNWKVFGPMFLGLGLTSLYAGGVQVWMPTFFQRTYGWAPQQIGYIIGIVSLVSTPFGLVLGTWVNERFTKRGYDDANLRVLLIAQTLGLPFAIAAPLMPTPWLSVIASVPFVLCAMMGAPSQNAALQIITPNEIRGQVTALFLFMFGVVGGLGPTLLSAITDYVLPSENDIRWAMSGCAVVLLPAAVAVFWYGVKPYGEEVKRLRLTQA